jgi:hypothetical protein
MHIGALYRMKHQLTALSAAEVTTQFETVRTLTGGGTLAGSLSFPGGASGSNMLVLGTPPTIGAGSYTIECWFRSPNFDAAYGLCGAIATGGLSVYVANSTTITTDKYGGGGSFSYTVPTMSANTWYHFVLVRSSTTSAVFLNGKRAGVTQTDSLNYNGTTPHIGSYYGQCWPGLMTNFRIVVGTAVYTPTFGFCTPPIGPLTNITNTKYLMLGADPRHDSSNVTAVTVTGAVTTSLRKPFVSYATTNLQLYLDAGIAFSYPGSGTSWTDLSENGRNGTLTNGPTYSSADGGSIVFDGTDDFVQCTGSVTATAATFIAWIRRNGTQGTYDGILSSRGTSVSGMQFYSSDQLGYIWNNAVNTYTWNSGLTVPDLTWCMVAVSVTSTSATAYLCESSGITSATNTVSHTSTTLDDIKIGQEEFGARCFSGNIAIARLYDTALSAGQISQLFDADKTRFGI